MKLRPLSSFAAALAAVSLPFAAPARAQSNPTFTFAKPDAPKPAEVTKPGTPPPPPPPVVEWKAMVKGGFTMTSGNSQTTGLVGTGSVSRKEGNNRVALDANGAYGRSNVLTPDVEMANPTVISGLHRTDIETTNNWLVKGRYDRFFTTNNSGYVAASAAADKIAGKTFYGGGQVGYSRQIFKNAMNLLVAEIGYDYSYESYVAVNMMTPPSVSIHSARLFAGETLTLTKATGITAGVEAFFNLNKETNALNASTGTPGVDAFHDTRINGKLGLTTTLFAKLSIGFGFTIKYDQNPAPLPIPPGSPAGATFAPGFLPFAQSVDTLTEATLIYTFL